MKLLLLVHGLPVGGTEVMASHLARRFRSRGVDVALGCLDEVGELGQLLIADGFPVEFYARRPGFDASLPLRIARSVRRGAFDVVHAHQYTPYFYAVLAKLLTGVPLVFTEHGRAYPDPPRIRRRAFNRLFARLVDRVTTVSADVKNSLWRVEGFDPERIQVLPNGIDVDRYPAPGYAAKSAARRHLGLPADAPIVGTVGRLDPVKNYPLLLGAFREVQAGDPRALLVVVGDGPERARLEGLARELGISRAVRFLGTRFDVALILPAFDVFALSSFSEGMPMTVVEAMAAGVPIVSTAVGGIPEMIGDGCDGLLVAGVPPACAGVRDLEASEYVRRFASALTRLVREHGLSVELAGNARQRARREYSLDGICRQYWALYREVVPTLDPAFPDLAIGATVPELPAPGSGIHPTPGRVRARAGLEVEP